MNAPGSNEERMPNTGEYVHVAYTGGFSRTGDVSIVDVENRRAFVDFHYSNVPSEWVAWGRLSYNSPALKGAT
jgi:hypothetical protein